MDKQPDPNRLEDGNARRKIRSVMNTDNGRILYMPSDSGFTKNPNGGQICYFGLTTTIPIKDYPFNIFEHEINMADLFTVLKEPSRDLIPLSNGIIERYEIQDLCSYDMHVMYRVPYVRYP